VSVGRVPNTDNLGLEAVGLGVDERGFIEVDDHCQTKVPGVWAIGDVVRGPMLAHKAEDEGVAVAERIAGQKPHIDFNTIPWVIYTSRKSPGSARPSSSSRPKAASTSPASSRSWPTAVRWAWAPDGFVKMLADAKTDEILGVHIVAANASDLIAEAVVAMEFKAASEDIGASATAPVAVGSHARSRAGRRQASLNM
jgi:dihydrolipoamide dehydrogenase